MVGCTKIPISDLVEAILNEKENWKTNAQSNNVDDTVKRDNTIQKHPQFKFSLIRTSFKTKK